MSPLGKKVEHPAEPTTEQWVPHAPGCEISTKTGHLRTALPLPPPAPPEPVADDGFCGFGCHLFKGLRPINQEST